jgi:hypothetical protein
MIASIFFAVFWSAGMIWWNAPGVAGAIVLMVGGALTGTGWFFAMRWWMNKFAPTQQ